MSSMAIQSLPQSADKKEIFRRLPLLTESIHRALSEEAEVARNRISWDPDSLTHQSRADPTIVPPYKFTEISETARHRAILDVVRAASVNTRPFYAMGHQVTSVNEDNWVARWYLWHSFRYRDNRPRQVPAGAPTLADDRHDTDDTDETDYRHEENRTPITVSPHGKQAQRTDGEAPQGNGYYDPVYERYRT